MGKYRKLRWTTRQKQKRAETKPGLNSRTAPITPFVLEMPIPDQIQKKNKLCEAYDKCNCHLISVTNTDFGSKLIMMPTVTLPQHCTKYRQMKKPKCFISISCCLSTIWFFLSQSSSQKILAGINMFSFNYRTGLRL